MTTTLRSKHPDWPVILGEHHDGAWCKAAAIAAALARTDAGMLIIHDADVYVPNLLEAVEHCETWSIPHRLVHRLDERATDFLIGRGRPGEGRAQRPYVGREAGGVLVILRDIYDQCPMDPRFRGWGQDDESLALALTTLYGPPWRGDADLWHLWHPPQQRLNRSTGSAAGSKLHARYRRAAGSPDAMRSLLAEVHPSRR